ncbi:MAG: carbon-nitrogen hydrolase family protein [Proteobacteria bacterium]|nr:carbon-nitrogen hydrolase family protein [Pseudomonadota bacterium]
MKIAAIQMVSGPDVAANCATAEALLTRAAARGARLACLPEYFCLMGHQDSDKLAIAEADGDGPLQTFLAATARRLGLWLVGGTIPLHASQPGRVRNACLVYGPAGQRVARYDKIHLFAFDNGREAYDEGRVLEAGDTPVAFDADGWRVGLSVCYDLRFPELYRALMHPPCDLLLVPAAFTYTTGEAHWSLLLRARAVENQCWTMGVAQGGRHANGRRTWGHSMVVDPWGEVGACLPEGAGVVLGELDASLRDTVRSRLPALAHRKV